jgi:F0F1-type ATP synthase assembly protein I
LTGLPQPDRPPKGGWRLSNPDDLRDPLQIGLTIVGVTAAFGGFGWWLDSLFHTFPILMAIGAVFGLSCIIYLTYIRLQASDTSQKKSDGPEPPSSDSGG